MNKFCRACSEYHDEKDFYIWKDEKYLPTANCAKSISKENIEANRKQNARHRRTNKNVSPNRKN